MSYSLGKTGTNIDNILTYLEGIPSGSEEGIQILAGSQIAADAFSTNTSNSKSYKAGQISFDPSSLTVLLDSSISGVRLQCGQEEWYLVCNNSGAQIDNGKVVYTSGVDATNGCLECALADNSSFATSASVLGITTHDIPDGTLGLVTYRGIVRDFDTSALSPSGITWLGNSGNLTNTQPLYPSSRIAMGTVISSHATTGQFMVTINRITRNDVSKSYSFTSTGIPAGTFWKAGFYDFNDTSVILSQASLTQAYGLAGRARAAHAGIVPNGAGTVDTGQVGLRVTGIRDYEDGTLQTAAQTGIITDDITTLTANTYFETIEKWSGEVTFELYVVSGSPTAYSLRFNYGFAKYDDLQDRDYAITGFECVWQGNANNNTLDIALMKHTSEGWTYAASGFIPGNGDLCRKSVDQALSSNVNNNMDGAYKRAGLDEYISGQSGEGHIIQVITGGAGTIQIMDIHVEGVSEELNF